MKAARTVLQLGLLAALSAALPAQAPTVVVPRIWDDAALADWATPVATLNVRPAHYSSAEYYSVPAENLRTYPLYPPDREPAGYWEELQKKRPEPLVDVSTIRSATDWIAAGERAFAEMDNFWSRTTDPALIAQARDPRSFAGVFTLPNGTAFGPRWVVTAEGVKLSSPACSACHVTIRTDGTVAFAGPRGPEPPGSPPLIPRGLGVIAANAPLAMQRFFEGDSVPVAAWRLWTVPWAPDERIESLPNAAAGRLQGLAAGDPGVVNRPHGSAYYATKIPDLHILRYSRYLDATGTHRLRGPEDAARYAAFITGADPMDFGPHHILTNAQRRVRFRYADEVLYAMGMYLMSLEPPKNPNPGASALIARGEQIFRREGCVNCHVPPNYTSGKLTPAQGWKPPANHPNRDDIADLSVGTDPGLALKTRKGTGFYKIPSLRGVWYRPRLLHDASLTSLEEMFDPRRTTLEYEPNGWNPPGVTKRAVPGHPFGLSLNAEDRNALLAFVRSL
jgi:mono/diheme cytochrome c family protein